MLCTATSNWPLKLGRAELNAVSHSYNRSVQTKVLALHHEALCVCRLPFCAINSILRRNRWFILLLRSPFGFVILSFLVKGD